MNPDLTEELIQDAHTNGLFQTANGGMQMMFVLLVLIFLALAAKKWLESGIDGVLRNVVLFLRWALTVVVIVVLILLGWVWLGSLWLPAFWMNWGGIAGQAIAWVELGLYGVLWLVIYRVLRRSRKSATAVNREVSVPSGAAKLTKREK